MKVHRKHKNFKARLKAARETGRIEGELKAADEYQKSLRKLAIETKVTIVQMEGAHEAQMKIIQRKEAEFAEGCESLAKERKKVKDALDNISFHAAEGVHHAKKVKTMYNDEKREKFGNLDYSEKEIEHHLRRATREAEKVGVH